MKLKKLFLTLSCVFLAFLPIQASTQPHILILCEDLPYIIIADVLDEQSVQMNMVASDIVLPMFANKLPTTVSSQNYSQDKETIKKSIEDFFSISIRNTIVVNLDTLSKDVDLPYNSTTFHSLHDITNYFDKVVDELDISMIFHYQNYIESDMNLSDYYHYYQIFKDNNVDIQYAYMNYLKSDSFSIPLDNLFHLSLK